MALRQAVTVYNADSGDSGATTAMPSVFAMPIRSDVVQQVHTSMAMNKRQAYAVMFQAGHLCFDQNSVPKAAERSVHTINLPHLCCHLLPQSNQVPQSV